MKKKLVLLTALLALSMLLPFTTARAKPAYCWEALSECGSMCDQTFGWPFNQGCRAGCGIGFLGCGG